MPDQKILLDFKKVKHLVMQRSQEENKGASECKIVLELPNTFFIIKNIGNLIVCCSYKLINSEGTHPPSFFDG